MCGSEQAPKTVCNFPTPKIFIIMANEKWLEEAKQFAEEQGFSVNGGLDTSKVVVNTTGDTVVTNGCTFANTFNESGKVRRLRIVAENTQKGKFLLELTFLNRPICVGDKIFIRDNNCFFVQLARKINGLSDAEASKIIEEALKEPLKFIVNEKLHVCDSHYRTEKIFIKQ